MSENVRDNSRDIMFIYTICDRGRAKNMMRELRNWGIKNHFQFVGVGTATSDMLDILGLGTSDKDILISLAPRARVEHFASSVQGSLDHVGKGRGLVMLIPLIGMGRLMETIILKQMGDLTMDKGAMEAGNSTRRSLVMIAVNAGYTDSVMEEAKLKGATGGTVIRGRLAGTKDLATEFGIEFEEEREIITILASADHRDDIMNAVNEKFGIRTPAQGIVCCVPVEKAFKI